MNAIEAFQRKHDALRVAESWRALIGKRYSGGRGGTGNVCNATVTLDIYHQKYDGAMNYHNMPHELRGFIERIVIQRGVELIDEALAVMRMDLRAAAKQATDEANEVLALASGTPSPATNGDNHGK